MRMTLGKSCKIPFLKFEYFFEKYQNYNISFKAERERLRGLNNRPEAEILISNALPRPLCPFIWNIFCSRLE